MGILRIALGWIFLWAFLDKIFGLGFATPAEKAWLLGTSPTYGFLHFGTKGIFTPVFKAIAGYALVDWLYMLGLFAVGVCLILGGGGVRVAGVAGSVLLLGIYLAGFMPPEHNPFLDEHLIYIIILTGCIYVRAGRYVGLGNWWRKTNLVKKFPFLE